MRKRNSFDELSHNSKENLKYDAIRFGSFQDGCMRYSLGETTLRKISLEANALIKVGRRRVIDFEVMDNYLRELANK